MKERKKEEDERMKKMQAWRRNNNRNDSENGEQIEEEYEALCIRVGGRVLASEFTPKRPLAYSWRKFTPKLEIYAKLRVWRNLRQRQTTPFWRKFTVK